VLDQAQTITPEGNEDDAEKTRKLLDQLGPDDLGKWKM